MEAPTRTAPYRIKPTWWLSNQHYFIFMMRELSAVFIAIFALELVRLLAAWEAGPEATAAAMATFANPAVIVFHVVALAFAVLHTVTFFEAGAVIMPLTLRGKKVPTKLLVAGNLGAWLGVSLVVAFLLGRG